VGDEEDSQDLELGEPRHINVQSDCSPEEKYYHSDSEQEQEHQDINNNSASLEELTQRTK